MKSLEWKYKNVISEEIIKNIQKFIKEIDSEGVESKELKENNIDNKYGIEYTKVGDYYIPNLVLEKEEKNYFK